MKEIELIMKKLQCMTRKCMYWEHFDALQFSGFYMGETLNGFISFKWVNSFVTNTPFLCPCFQGIEKGCIGNKWVNVDVDINPLLRVSSEKKQTQLILLMIHVRKCLINLRKSRTKLLQ